MYKDKKILALIPARAGSKGLPNKNIKPLCGKPLIGWTIEQAKSSKYIDSVYVSTEDDKISEISRSFGAEIPFVRPQSLAQDDSKGIDVIFHCIDFVREHKKDFDLLMWLQPTSPLRIVEDIDASIELLFKKDAKSIISVCESERSPLLTNKLPADGCMENFARKTHINENRQEMGIFYRNNGVIFLAYLDYIQKRKSFYGSKTFAYIMPQERSADVDSELDFYFCECLMERNQKKHEYAGS